MASGCLKGQGLDTPGGKSLTGFLPMEIQKSVTSGKLYLVKGEASDIGKLLLTRSSSQRTLLGLL